MRIMQDARFGLDQHAINHMTVAVACEMTPGNPNAHALGNTLFMGGPRPSESDARAIGAFGERKNYNIVFPSFQGPDVEAGPDGYHAVVTDGVAETFVLSDGRLWRRDRRSPAVLVFAGIQAVVKLSLKGRMIVRGMTGGYAEEGFELARRTVVARAAQKPGKVPVVSPIGGMAFVLDMGTLAETFALAA